MHMATTKSAQRIRNAQLNVSYVDVIPHIYFSVSNCTCYRTNQPSWHCVKCVSHESTHSTWRKPNCDANVHYFTAIQLWTLKELCQKSTSHIPLPHILQRHRRKPWRHTEAKLNLTKYYSFTAHTCKQFSTISNTFNVLKQLFHITCVTTLPRNLAFILISFITDLKG